MDESDEEDALAAMFVVDTTGVSATNVVVVADDVFVVVVGVGVVDGSDDEVEIISRTLSPPPFSLSDLSELICVSYAKAPGYLVTDAACK